MDGFGTARIVLDFFLVGAVRQQTDYIAFC